MISRLTYISKRSVLLVILSLSISGSVFSQIAGGANETTSTNFGGKSFISGTVFGPDGARINGRIRIRLSAMTGGEVIATTDDRGEFVFSGLWIGYYTISIDREEAYEPVSQQVEVQQLPGAPPPTYTVTFRLKERVKTAPKPPVINSENAAVPKRAMDFYTKAQALSAKGDNKGAIEQLKLAIAEYPDFMVALTELGVQYLKLNELEKADEYLQLALKIKPNAFEPLVNRGILLVRAKRYDEAETTLRAALKVKQESAIGHFYLGRALANLKRYDEAEKEFNSSITIGGDEMKEAHRLLASMYLEKGDDKRALAELETYLALAPTAPDAEKLRTVIRQLKEQDTPKP